MLRFSEKAIEHIESIMTRKKAYCFRLSIKATGCSGLMYMPEVVTTHQETDVKVDAPIETYIAADALGALSDTYIDYVQKSFGQKQLVFDNPNADSLCGCGESFHLNQDKTDA